MLNKVFKFDEASYLGKTINVETGVIKVEVENELLLDKFSVGNLLTVINDKKNTAYIGIVNRVMNDTSKTEKLVFYVYLSLIGTFYEKYNGKKYIYKRGINTFPTIQSKCYLIEGQNLYNLMYIIGREVDEKDQLVIGKFALEGKAKAILNGDIFFQRHASILGSTGSGKSWCVASILEQANKLKYSNIIVFDIHGEYKPLSEGVKSIATRYKIAGPGDKIVDEKNTIYLPYWLLKAEELISLVINKENENSNVQALRLTTHLERLKEKTLQDLNKEEIRDTFTIDSPVPYKISELIRLLNIDNTKKNYGGATGEAKLGIWEGRLTDLVNTLRAKTGDKKYSFLFSPHDKTLEYEWLGKLMTNILGVTAENKTIKIIDFSEVPSDILPIVTGKIVSLIYDIQFWMDSENRTPINIICDEAHLYLPEIKDNERTKHSLENFEKIAKEGRKYSVSLTVVSQRPNDVSKIILSQCNNFIALRLTNEGDRQVVKSLIPDSLSGIVDMLPLLGIGEAMVFGDAVLMPSKIQLTIPKIKPDSNTKDYWIEWNTKKPVNSSVFDAVEIMRKQTRLTISHEQDDNEKQKEESPDFI